MHVCSAAAELHACLVVGGFQCVCISVCPYSTCRVSVSVRCVCMCVGREAVGLFYIKPADMHNDPVTCMHLSNCKPWQGKVVYPQQCGKRCSAESLNGFCIFTWALNTKQLNTPSHISQLGCAHCHQLRGTEPQH